MRKGQSQKSIKNEFYEGQLPVFSNIYLKDKITGARTRSCLELWSLS